MTFCKEITVPMATVTSKGQITLPAELRSELDIQPGDRIVFFTALDGRRGYRVSRPRVGAGQGMIKADKPSTLEEFEEALLDALAEKYAPGRARAQDE
jgi:AbrB family looped-hinge helix DNA binding protein